MRKKKEEGINYEKYESELTKGREAFAKYGEMFEDSKNFTQTRQAAIVENMAFYEGNQYELSSYIDDRPWVVQSNTPHASVAIDTRVSSLMANDYMGVLQPYTSEEKEDVENLQHLVDDLFGELGINRKIDKCIKNSAITRESYLHINASKVKRGGSKFPGSLKAYQLDTLNVLLDPKARSYDECEYLIIRGRINKKKAKKEHPMLRILKTGDNYSAYDRGERYANNDYTTNQEDIWTKLTFYVKDYTEDGVVIRKVTTIEGVVVEEKVLKGMSTFPIAQLRWQESSQSAYGMSLMDSLISSQKAVNSIESAITNTAIGYAYPSYVVNKASGISVNDVAESAGAPGVVYSSAIDPRNSMAPVQQPEISPNIIKTKEDNERNIDKIAGITSQFTGALGTAGNTAGGATQAVERAKIIEESVLLNVSIFVEQIVRILVDYIGYLYDTEDTVDIRKTDPNGKTSFVKKPVPKDIPSLQFSFFVDLSTRTKYSEQKEKATLQELYQIERQYDAPVKFINEIDILEKSQLKNIDVYKDRYEQLSIQTDENKLNAINKIAELGKLGIDENLIKQAQLEIMSGDKERKMVNQVMQEAQKLSQANMQKMQKAEDEARQMGVPEESITKAHEKALKEGVTF